MASEWERLLDAAAGFAEQFADQARQRMGELGTSQTEGIWRRAELALRDHYERLGDSLKLSWSGGFPVGTPEHPLHAYAIYSLPTGHSAPFERMGNWPGSVSSVEVSVDFRKDGTGFRYSSRISRREAVLREGPSGVIDTPYGAIGSYGKIKFAIAEIGRFIEGSGQFIREQLQATAGLCRRMTDCTSSRGTRRLSRPRRRRDSSEKACYDVVVHSCPARATALRDGAA